MAIFWIARHGLAPGGCLAFFRVDTVETSAAWIESTKLYGAIENFMTEAVFPTLLRQDPRFFQLGKGGFWKRTAYAVSRIFVTRTDSGHNQFNFSEILGSASGGRHLHLQLPP